MAARIFAVIDVWDALSSDRPYRKGWTEEKVQAFILSSQKDLLEMVIKEAEGVEEKHDRPDSGETRVTGAMYALEQGFNAGRQAVIDKLKQLK